MESYEKIKKVLALGFMNFLDENKPKDKMCLSNGECVDIEKAFNEQDWPKLARYLDKYTESEDEMIMKILSDVFAISGDRFISEYERKLVVPWLEKQKEQKPAEKQDYSGLTDLERAIHRGFLVAGVENVPVTIIKQTAQDCLAQKPAWSEEDEENIESIKIILRKALSKGISCEEEVLDLTDWLQSIRPSWKPSEEQMKALESCFCEFGEGYPDEDGLRSLYNDLKKLCS